MRILGIDYGSVRIGLALSDPTGLIAYSLQVVNRIDIQNDIKQIADVIGQYQVESIVVGMPVSMDGSLGKKAKEVIIFIDKMKENIKIPIVRWDERFTTVISERMLIDANLSRKKRKKVIDGVAASVMLQNYLDFKKNE